MLPPDVAPDAVHTFMIMYRTHCQRILNTVNKKEFGDLEGYFKHFWQGVPSHLRDILHEAVRWHAARIGLCLRRHSHCGPSAS